MDNGVLTGSLIVTFSWLESMIIEGSKDITTGSVWSDSDTYWKMYMWFFFSQNIGSCTGKFVFGCSWDLQVLTTWNFIRCISQKEIMNILLNLEFISMSNLSIKNCGIYGDTWVKLYVLMGIKIYQHVLEANRLLR